jgi:hypothetical protein
MGLFVMSEGQLRGSKISSHVYSPSSITRARCIILLEPLVACFLCERKYLFVLVLSLRIFEFLD